MLGSGIEPWLGNVGRGRCSDSEPQLPNVRTRSPRTETVVKRGEVGDEVGALATVLQGVSCRGKMGERTGPRTELGKGSGGLHARWRVGVTRRQTMRNDSERDNKGNSQGSRAFPTHTLRTC